MSEAGSTLVVSGQWFQRTEVAVTMRAVAGAASRFSEVVVAVPGQPGKTSADGAFDIHEIDLNEWRHSAAVPDILGRPLASFQRVIIDELTDDISAVVNRIGSPQRTFMVLDTALAETKGDCQRLQFLPLGDDDTNWLGMHVPVNPLAATHRHNGLGFTGYILVLSNRSELNDPRPPTDMVAWITAGFHHAQVVVIEDGAAAVWQGRALRGVVGVETRTDLWRLIAHAQCVVDVAPGPVIAQECVEALRFGTPIAVPAGTAAAAHTWSGGGVTFADVAGLLEALDLFADSSRRSAASNAGKQYADANFGNASRFVERLASVLVG